MSRISVRARRSDPETSHQAALDFESNQPKAQMSVACVMLILKQYGKPMSDFQIREVWPKFWGKAYSYTLPSKARHWAREAGLVKHDGFGVHYGRQVRTWSIGRDNLFLTPDAICECCGQKIRRQERMAA
jgi:hypothetical protein